MDDESTCAQHACGALAFRGISDTDLPDMLWVAEYLVYQQLAADNAAAMARAWVAQWRGR